MPAQHALAEPWHRHETCRRHLRRFEALVDGEPEHEWVAARQTREQGYRRSMIQAQVFADLFLQRGAVTALGRLVRKALDVVRPDVLRAETALDDGLDAIANLRAGIAVHRPFERSRVVVDEASRGHHRRRLTLFLLEELQGAGDRVRGARAQLALVVAGGEAASEIDPRRQRARQARRRLVAEVALVRN